VTATLDRVNGATFKTWRQALGLASPDVAKALDVGVEAARRYEAPYNPRTRLGGPSKRAVEWIEDLREKVYARYEDIVNGVTPGVVDGREVGVNVTLQRYRDAESAAAAGETLPWRAHNAMIGMAMTELTHRGHTVTVVWAEP